MGPFRYKLFENQNGTHFIDQASAKNVDSDIFGWGALWVDYNNDGYEDIYVATGNNFGEIQPTPSTLYRNEEGSTFTLINDSIDGDIESFSFCPVKGDLNNDGYYDIAVLNKDTLPNLLMNEGNQNNYIKITPVGIVSNRMAIGAQIRIHANGVNQLQTVFCGENLFAQSSQHKIFGVDTSTVIDSISILFPSGITAKRYNVTVNQSIIIYEEEYVTVDFNINSSSDPMILCNGDSLHITLSGYDNYHWSDGTNDSTLVITGPGTYYFEALNEMGDTLYRSEDIVIINEQIPLFQESAVDVDCNDDFSGAASLIFANIAQIDSVVWSNGKVGFEIDSLPSDVYDYTITTTNGCVYYGSVLVSEMEDFYLEIQTTPYTNTSSGSISIYTFGGTMPFTFLLNGDTISNNVSCLNSGSYSLIAMDANGCVQEETIFIDNLSTVGYEAIDTELKAFINNNRAILNITNPNIEYIELFNISGSNVANLRSTDWEQSERTIEFNFPYPRGVYIMVIHTQKDIFQEKVIKP